MDEPKAEDPKHLECASLDRFLAATAQRGIRHAVLRTIREIRPRHLPGHRVEVGPQGWIELASYADGVLITARLEGADPTAVQGEMEGRGLEVRTISGNVG